MAGGALFTQMIKKILLPICLMFAVLAVAKLSPIFADARCGGGWHCTPSQASSQVWFTGCKYYSSNPSNPGSAYCAGDGYTGDTCYCSTSGTPDCSCVVRGNIRCAVGGSVSEQCYCQESGNNCKKNPDGTYDNSNCEPPSAAYPNGDICSCNSSGHECVLEQGQYTWYCCMLGDDGPGPTDPPGQPTNTPYPPTPTPTPARVLTVNINVYRASSAYNQSSCTTSASDVTPYNQPASISLQYQPQPIQTKDIDTNTGSVSFTVSDVVANNQLTVTINPLDDSYSCLCPNGCTYALTVPPVGTNDISRNIYLSNFANSWWQVFGGNTFLASGQFRSIVPDTSCTSPACLAGVFLPMPGPSQNSLSSGFPFLQTKALQETNIRTHQDATKYLNNIHLSRTESADGVVLGFQPADLDYNYFYQLAANNGTINKFTSTPLDLATWRTNHDTQGLTIFELSGDQTIRTISQNNKVFVQNGEKVVVFVDGDLIIEDSQVGGNGNRITTVAPGGFLGIFVSGNINIKHGVGTALDTGNPANITAVDLSTAHLNGVFFSDGRLTIEGNTTIYPNYKFIGAGTFIGKTGVTLGRQTDDDTKIHNSYQALENFIYRADFLVNWPSELKSSIINWREVAPKSFN